jgi:hypothetical protein
MDGGRENGFLEDEEFGSEEEPDGQLLLEIIRKEEDRDLRQLVSDALITVASVTFDIMVLKNDNNNSCV